MDNTYSALQILAISEADSLDFLKVPDITNNLSRYNSFKTVSSSANIWSYLNSGNISISSNSVSLLQGMGSKSFPALFGIVPINSTQNLGYGLLFNKVINRISSEFNNTNDSSIYVQTYNAAQIYASSAKEIYKSTITSNFGSQNNPTNLVTGGLSNIVGTNVEIQKNIAEIISNLGTLLNYQNPSASFSAADIFYRISEQGLSWLSNLHVNFYGQYIQNPKTAETVQVTQDFLKNILSNPVGNLYPVVANNDYEIPLRNLANQALTKSIDLQAVLAFVGITDPVLSNIQKFSDCLELSILFGGTSKDLANNLGINILNAENVMYAFTNNIKGFNNIQSSSSFGQSLASIQTLQSLPSITSNITANALSKIQIGIGNGTGFYGNPTITDILGQTNVNDILNITSNSLYMLNNLSISNIIASDISNVSLALNLNSANGIYLSDGNTYTSLDLLIADAVPLIDKNSNLLIQTNSYQLIANNFSSYDMLGSSHNRSIGLSKKAEINVSSYISSLPTAINFIKGLNQIIVGDDEIYGYSVIQPLINNLSLSGQSVSAVIIEAQNGNILSSAGILTDSFTPSEYPSMSLGMNGNSTVGNITITISPISPSIVTDNSEQFSALVVGTDNLGVTWEVNGLQGGNSFIGVISQDGLYLAPTITGIYTITARSVVDLTVFGNTNVSVTSTPSGSGGLLINGV